MKDQEFSDVNVRAEAGAVVMEFKGKITGEPFRAVLSKVDANRIANALKICASAPPDIESVNFDVRTD